MNATIFCYLKPSRKVCLFYHMHVSKNRLCGQSCLPFSFESNSIIRSAPKKENENNTVNIGKYIYLYFQ